MDNEELIYKSCWVFKFNEKFNIMKINGIKNKHELKDNVILFNISNITTNSARSNNVSEELESLKQQIKEKDLLENFIEIVKNMNEVEVHCQVLVLTDVKILIVLCEDIRLWENFFNSKTLDVIPVINKELLEGFVDKGYCSNILSITTNFNKSDNLINAVNIHGSNIQLSDDYLRIMEDSDTEIVSCIFQPKGCNFLITLRKDNKIEVSKYVKSKEHIKALIDVISLLNEINNIA